MKLLREVFSFLTQKAVLSVALGLIVSSSVSDLTKGFTDDMMLPLLNPVMKSLGAHKLEDWEVKALGATLRIGRFVQSLIRFLVLMLVVTLLTKVLKRRGL